ncbi:MAG: hypothetical protein V7765_19095 [Oleispira sp.]
MESKKLNVTEEWLQVITQLTLSYRRKLNETVKDDVQDKEVIELVSKLNRSNEIKQENRMF